MKNITEAGKSFSRYSEETGCKHQMAFTSRVISHLNHIADCRGYLRQGKEQRMEQLSIVINDMEDVTKAIDQAQRKACTSIVEIGYVLRKADDAELFRQKGYSSIFEFAKQEYGWDKAQTSRFMAINREYSEGGYSTVLKAQYEGYGQAKLSEMLLLPEQIREELHPDMKRDEIREIKREYQAAEQARQFEDFGKSFTPEAAVEEESLLVQSIRYLFELDTYARRIPKLWPLLQKKDAGEDCNEQDIFLALSENGYGNQRAGSCMYFFKKDNFIVMRGMSKEEHSYNELLEALLNLSSIELSEENTWYEKTFGKNLPEDEKTVPKVTPVSKVRGREVVTPKPAAPTKKEEKKVPESPKNQEEHPVLEGQSNISEFAETMPVTYENAKNEEKTEPAKVAPASEVRGRDQIEAEQKEGAEPAEVVPDVVDGECQYCAGNKDIETNDGSFHLHLTKHGTGRIELDSGLRYGIIEISYCPMCGRKMEE